LRDAPASVHLIDHIEYDDAPESAVANAGASANSGAVWASGSTPGIRRHSRVTDVISATAMLHDPSGRVVSQCLTPCSFNDLTPDQYSLEVRKSGYQPVQTALQVKQGSVADQKTLPRIVVQSLYITSEPAAPTFSSMAPSSPVKLR